VRLTKEQRAALFRGELPRITYPSVTPKLRIPKPCPVESGDVYSLGAYQELIVIKVRRSRLGDYVVVYEIHVKHRPLYLAQTGPQATTQTERNRFTEEQARGYTHSRARALDPEAEAVMFVGDNDPILVDARKRFAEHGMVEHVEAQVQDQSRQLAKQVRDVAVSMVRSGVDPSQFFADLGRQINAQRNNSQDAA
jgi:hypothetical protein